MWTDPISLEYAFFGLDRLSMIAGLVVAVSLATSSFIFHHRRGQRGKGLIFLSLSTFIPLAVSAFLVRTMVAFLLIIAHWTFESTSALQIIRPGADISIIIFSLGVLYLLLAASPSTMTPSKR